MPASRASRTARDDMYIVHPASTSRLERKGEEYRKVQAKFKALEQEKKALMADLCKLIRREGEADEKGKLRYETDVRTFLHIEAENAYTDAKKALQHLVKLGVKPLVARKALRLATSHTPYEYVLMTEKKEKE